MDAEHQKNLQARLSQKTPKFICLTGDLPFFEKVLNCLDQLPADFLEEHQDIGIAAAYNEEIENLMNVLSEWNEWTLTLAHPWLSAFYVHPLGWHLITFTNQLFQLKSDEKALFNVCWHQSCQNMYN